MRHFLTGLALGASVAVLASCATVSPQVHLTVAQALSVSEVAVDGANQAATAAAKAGVVHGPSAITLKGYIDTGNAATSAAHEAYKSGDLTNAAALAQQALQSLAKANDASKGAHP